MKMLATSNEMYKSHSLPGYYWTKSCCKCTTAQANRGLWLEGELTAGSVISWPDIERPGHLTRRWGEGGSAWPFIWFCWRIQYLRFYRIIGLKSSAGRISSGRDIKHGLGPGKEGVRPGHLYDVAGTYNREGGDVSVKTLQKLALVASQWKPWLLMIPIVEEGDFCPFSGQEIDIEDTDFSGHHFCTLEKYIWALTVFGKDVKNHSHEARNLKQDHNCQFHLQ